MLPGAITTMLDTLARDSGPGAQADHMKRFGRALLHAPDDAAQLLAAIAGSPTAGAREERMSRLLSSALDEARNLEIERKRLENALLQKQIDLLEKHQDYRCCPAFEDEL